MVDNLPSWRYCRGCGEEDYVCAQYPCGEQCSCPKPPPLLTLPTERPDFQRFGENIAWFSWMLRLQIIFSLATDELFAVKAAKAYSATARLKAIATTCNATTLEVT